MLLPVAGSTKVAIISTGRKLYLYWSTRKCTDGLDQTNPAKCKVVHASGADCCCKACLRNNAIYVDVVSTIYGEYYLPLQLLQPAQHHAFWKQCYSVESRWCTAPNNVQSKSSNENNPTACCSTLSWPNRSNSRAGTTSTSGKPRHRHMDRNSVPVKQSLPSKQREQTNWSTKKTWF